MPFGAPRFGVAGKIGRFANQRSGMIARLCGGQAERQESQYGASHGIQDNSRD
jgi:hypothetical protein